MVNSLLLPLHPVFKGSQFSPASFTALLGVGDVYRSIHCSWPKFCSDHRVVCVMPPATAAQLSHLVLLLLVLRMWCRRLACLLGLPCWRSGRAGHGSLGLPRGTRTVPAAAARCHHTAPESLSCAWQLHGDHLGRCVVLSLLLSFLGRGARSSWPCFPVVILFWNRS